jgi:hypothetical protein
MFDTGTASDYADLLDRLNTFLTAKGSAFGLAYEGTGTGSLTDYSGGASSVAETFTITASSATLFDVVGSVSGDIGDATVGTPFSHAKLEFTITAGGTAFVSGDEFTLATAPPWTEKRFALGCRLTATQGNTGLYAVQNIVDGKIGPTTEAYWRIASPITVPQDVEIEFFEAETVAEYHMAQFTSAFYNYGPKAWTLDYWDGDSWETLDSQSGINTWGPTSWKIFTITSPVSATKYRLHITELNGAAYLQIGALRMLRSTGIDAAFSQVIWEAPGNDGDSEILVGAHLFERQDADYFNLELAAFDGYSASERFYQQAGCHARVYVPLWDTSIPYWFVCDGRRAIVIAKLSTQYEAAYLGLIEPFFSPDQWPYPIAVGGSLALGDPTPAWNNSSWRYSNATVEHRIFTHSDPTTITGGTIYDYQMRARDLSGSWLQFAGRVNNGAVSSVYEIGRLWPTASGLTLLDANRDGSYQTFPVMLNTPAPNTIGALAGVRIVSGQGLTSETLVAEGEVDWIVINDVFRTDRDDYLAIALD